MRTQLISVHSARKLTLSLALAAVLAGLGSGPLAAVAEEKKDSATFTEKMKKWQNAMTDTFRDAWKGLRDRQGESSLASASVDLREQKDGYTVRLSLPERDLSKVEITLDEDELLIVAPAEGKAGRYEQKIVLANAAPESKPQVERRQKDSLIVITVPKDVSLADSDSPTIPDPSLLPGFSTWDGDILAHMEKMRRQMDRIFDESFYDFGKLPEYQGFFDRPRFGSSLDLQEEGDNYVIRAYLPDRDMENVNVTLENETVLKIEAKAEEREEKGNQGAVKSRLSRYAQVVTLPGPVQGTKIKIDKKEGMIVVTLPKQR